MSGTTPISTDESPSSPGIVLTNRTLRNLLLKSTEQFDCPKDSDYPNTLNRVLWPELGSSTMTASHCAVYSRAGISPMPCLLTVSWSFYGDAKDVIKDTAYAHLLEEEDTIERGQGGGGGEENQGGNDSQEDTSDESQGGGDIDFPDEFTVEFAIDHLKEMIIKMPHETVLDSPLVIHEFKDDVYHTGLGSSFSVQEFNLNCGVIDGSCLPQVKNLEDKMVPFFPSARLTLYLQHRCDQHANSPESTDDCIYCQLAPTFKGEKTEVDRVTEAYTMLSDAAREALTEGDMEAFETVVDQYNNDLAKTTRFARPKNGDPLEPEDIGAEAD